MNAFEVFCETVKAYAVAARGEPTNNVYGNAFNLGHKLRHILLEVAPIEAQTFINGIVDGVSSSCIEETSFQAPSAPTKPSN